MQRYEPIILVAYATRLKDHDNETLNNEGEDYETQDHYSRTTQGPYRQW